MRNFFIRNERDGTTLETPVCGRRIEDAQAVFAYVYPEARILGARMAKPGEEFAEKVVDRRIPSGTDRIIEA